MKNFSLLTKHTPGPWRRNGTRVYRADVDGETPICEALPLNVGYPDANERTANARLIAAAPQMLAAIKAVVKNGYKHPDVFELLKTAIAKAEGES